MKKKTIGILATSVAVCALCIVTDVSAIAGGGVGAVAGMGVGADTAAGSAAAADTAAGSAALLSMAWGVGSGTAAGSARSMDLLPVVALVMGGVVRLTPSMGMHLLATP
jgi:hypothetical protein